MRHVHSRGGDHRSPTLVNRRAPMGVRGYWEIDAFKLKAENTKATMQGLYQGWVM